MFLCLTCVKMRPKTSGFFCISEGEMIETREYLKYCFKLGKTV